MAKFGLIGKNISYSFSKTFFSDKFKKEQLPHVYVNFDLQNKDIIPSVLNQPGIIGLNVTIPYKQEVMDYLDELDDVAQKIGAVNTIKVLPDGSTRGFNTDYHGFIKAISPFLKPSHEKALILGTGGASKAIAYALDQLGIDYTFVSRNENPKVKYIYSQLTEAIIQEHSIIINCTPLGTFPNVNVCPDIPYDGISSEHLLFDLIYNPIQTKFLICGELQGAATCNGYDMLVHQAEKAWEIWNQ